MATSHIISTNTEETVGVVVKSVRFSAEVRTAVFIIATSLLSELEDYQLKYYTGIRKVARMFNINDEVTAINIRNAIRTIDLRIAHCESDKTIYAMIPVEGFSHTTVFCSEPQTNYIAPIHCGLVKPHYNGVTMVTMKTVRQILVDSLITITPEFE
jgi:hypothetical protein